LTLTKAGKYKGRKKINCDNFELYYQKFMSVFCQLEMHQNDKKSAAP